MPKILWNHDLDAPRFFPLCRTCGKQVGEFDTLARAQGATLCVACDAAEEKRLHDYIIAEGS